MKLWTVDVPEIPGNVSRNCCGANRGNRSQHHPDGCESRPLEEEDGDAREKHAANKRDHWSGKARVRVIMKTSPSTRSTHHKLYPFIPLIANTSLSPVASSSSSRSRQNHQSSHSHCWSVPSPNHVSFILSIFFPVLSSPLHRRFETRSLHDTKKCHVAVTNSLDQCCHPVGTIFTVLWFPIIV